MNTTRDIDPRIVAAAMRRARQARAEAVRDLLAAAVREVGRLFSAPESRPRPAPRQG